jgi:hypothetical protein
MKCLNCSEPLDVSWCRICLTCVTKIEWDIRVWRGNRWKAFAMAHGTTLFEGLEEECRRLGLSFKDGRVAWPDELSEEQNEFAGHFRLINDASESLEAMAGLMPKPEPVPDLNELLGLKPEWSEPRLKETPYSPELRKLYSASEGLRRI